MGGGGEIAPPRQQNVVGDSISRRVKALSVGFDYFTVIRNVGSRSGPKWASAGFLL